MHGNRIKNIVVAAILLGFCIYVIKLFVGGDINLYIHPRYSLFALLMSTVAALVLATGILIELKRHKKVALNTQRFNWLDKLVVLVLLLAFLLPPQALSSKSLGKRSLNTPTYSSSSDSKGCPAENPESLVSWVYQISQHSPDCFKGDSINLTGFVMQSSSQPLPNNMFYLGRIVMSCCVIDSRTYALPVKSNDMQFPDDTWLKIDGTLELAKINGSYQLVVEPKNITQIKDPDKPYEFYGQDQPTILEEAPQNF